MFKFFWGKGSHQSAERLKIQKELFQFQKTAQHGFPSKPTALAWDPVLRLLCIGTRTGALKIFGAPGVEFYGQLSKDKIICSLHFIPGHGRVIVVCEDNSLQLWEISTDGSPVLKCVHSQSLEGKLKKISACCVESSGENLLIGTENGNIYIMDLLQFEMTDSVIYLDVVMQNVTEDFKVNPGAVECVSEQPNSSEHILIGYTRGLLVLWNRKTLSADQTFVASQQLESASWYPNGKKFVSAHNDGSSMIWTLGEEETEVFVKKEPNTTSHYGPDPCKAITKILWSKTDIKEECGILVFGGGMPRLAYGDRHTLSVVKGEKTHITYDFTSKVIDFCLINEVSTGQTEALVVLAEEELIVVDLISPGWPTFSLPYLASLHCSAVTAHSVVTVTSELYEKIKANPQGMTPSSKISARPWPINGGISINEQVDLPSHRILLLTGHEDGSIRFWDASTASLFQISKFSTSSCFSSDDLDCTSENDEADIDEDEWPPFRKIGVFDPYSDDPRLAVKKLCLCPVTGLLIVAGTAGQVVVAELSETQAEKEVPIVLVNIVSDRDNFVWKGHDKLIVRKGLLSFKPGFQPTSVLQLHPPAAATALAVNSEWSVLAVGTAHGLTLYDIKWLQNALLIRMMCQELEISQCHDENLLRNHLENPLGDCVKGVASVHQLVLNVHQLHRYQKSKTITNTQCCAIMASEVRHVERQIEARNVMLDDGNKRHVEPVNAQLAKEIQLKHRAPVVSINIIDASYAAIGESLETSGITTISEPCHPHRVVISSEEQFKVFTLPNLRPYGKYKLTAYTGCKVRRVAVIPFQARSDSSYKENCLVCLSNQGDFHILSLPDLRRQMNAQAIRKEDIHATSTVVLTHQGEAFYMLSSSELQRVALSARNSLQLKCKVIGMKNNLPSTESSAQAATKISASIEEKLEVGVGTELSDVSVVSNMSNPNEDRENDKNICNNEINNSTIVSVEPETSFGDMTVDSVKDHIILSLDECRITEVASETRIEEVKTVLSSVMKSDETSDISKIISIEESYSFTQHESKTTVQLESEVEKRLVSQECSVSDSMSESSGAIAIKDPTEFMAVEIVETTK
uniref:Lethal(2) giant larvae protein n=1 Tax=Daphnia galeata TaxID=27404 RepID=A0A8J2RTR1_9CRUS|nr:unnamed protein product [Daphnia galeata]